VILVEDVEKALGLIAERLGVSREEARRILHRYVCRGLCGWYKAKAEEEGFADMVVVDEQAKVVEEVLRQVVEGLSMEDRFKRVHRYLCPRGPCSM